MVASLESEDDFSLVDVFKDIAAEADYVRVAFDLRHHALNHVPLGIIGGNMLNDIIQREVSACVVAERLIVGGFSGGIKQAEIFHVVISINL